MRAEGPDLDLSLTWDAQLGVEPVEDVDSFDELARASVPLKLLLNALNRRTGKDDRYPFRLTPAVLEKLRFVQRRDVLRPRTGRRDPLAVARRFTG